jgi:AraC-like DNA-binding protein
MDRIRENMDGIRALVAGLADWVSRHPAPPVVFATYQQTRSYNQPSPYVGFVYQDGAVCPWWELAGARYPFPANHLVVLNTRLGSRSAPLRGRGGLWICTFNAAEWERYDDLLRCCLWAPQRVRRPDRLCRAYREAAFQLVRRGPGLFLKAAVLQFLAVALDELKAVSGNQPAAPARSTEKAVRFLHANYARPGLALPDVAAAAGLSSHHFGRVFRREMGAPPMKYLQALRIAQSEHLLTFSDLRVKEVASETGFADPLHFSRIFRRVTRTSPRQYRLRQLRVRKARGHPVRPPSDAAP